MERKSLAKGRAKLRADRYPASWYQEATEKTTTKDGMKQLQQLQQRKRTTKKQWHENTVALKLPYKSEALHRKVSKIIKKIQPTSESMLQSPMPHATGHTVSVSIQTNRMPCPTPREIGQGGRREKEGTATEVCDLSISNNLKRSKMPGEKYRVSNWRWHLRWPLYWWNA